MGIFLYSHETVLLYSLLFNKRYRRHSQKLELGWQRTKAQIAENKSSKADNGGEVLAEGAISPSLPAVGSGDRWKFPHQGPGQSTASNTFLDMEGKCI